MDRWSQLELLTQIAERGSLTKAAEALGLSNSAASRQLKALESRLGTRLVERNTRRLWLTEAGLAFSQRCKNALDDVLEAEASVSARNAHVSGVLHLTGPLSFCMSYIAPILPAFMELYPAVRAEVIGANRYDDLIDSGVDIAFRTRHYEPDSNIVSRPLAKTGRSLIASPAYLARYGTPRHPRDLATHRFLLYSHQTYPAGLKFHARHGSSTVSVKLSPVLEANDGQILRAAALAGMGLLVQPNYIHFEDVVRGDLVKVLPDWPLAPVQINIAYQSRKHLPAKSQAFIDFIVRYFESNRFAERWNDQ